MNHTSSDSATDRVSARVEAACNCGCTAVRGVIQALEKKEPVDVADGLDSGERRALLNELRAIMAVYDER